MNIQIDDIEFSKTLYYGGIVEIVDRGEVEFTVIVYVDNNTGESTHDIEFLEDVDDRIKSEVKKYVEGWVS